jgi:L-gulonolactone oxidase
MPERFETWGRTFTCAPAEWARPTTEAEVVDVVRRATAAGRKVKVVGAGHSWSDMALTDGVVLQLDRLDRRVTVDKQRGLATFEAGIRLHALNDALAAEGLALPIVGSIDQQSLGGLLATGTHGSSLRHGNLSTQIVAMRIVTASGGIWALEEGDPRLPAARVALGAFGVVTQVTLRVDPAFTVAEETLPMSFDAAVAALPGLAAEAEYAKLWWIPHTDRAQLFRGARTTDPGTFSLRVRALDEHVVNAVLFAGLLRLGAWLPAVIPALNALIGAVYFRPTRVVGRSDHVLTLAMPPVHRESEIAIPAEHAGDALRRIRALVVERDLRINFILEARYVRADDSWMSPASGRDSVQIGAYTANATHCAAWHEGFAAIMADYGGRPHWGKEATFDSATVRRLYPMAERFGALVREADPTGTFRNAFVERVIGPV